MRYLSLAALLFVALATLEAQNPVSLPAQSPPMGALSLAAGNTLQGSAGTASAISYTVLGAEAGAQGYTYRTLAQGQLATTAGVLYAVPANLTSFVTLVSLVNTTNSAVNTVLLGVNGTAASNQILPSATIPASGFATFAFGVWHVYDGNGNLYQTGTQAFDATAVSPTTPGALGTVGTATTAAHRDHTHQSPGACASIVAEGSAIINAQAQVVSCALPANFMQAGTTFRVTASGTVTTSSTPGNDTFRVRIGTTTLTGNIAATVVAAANASITAQNFYLEFLVTVRTAGATGSVVGQGIVWSENATTGAFTAINVIGMTTSTVAVDTTAAKVIELTALTGASSSSVTVENAAIEVVKM